jgi:hypothetical protein
MKTDLNTFCRDIEQNDTLLCTLDEEARRQATACHPGPAHYRCDSCGAMADAPTNVCHPVQLPEIHWLGDGADNVNLEGHCR